MENGAAIISKTWRNCLLENSLSLQLGQEFGPRESESRKSGQTENNICQFVASKFISAKSIVDNHDDRYNGNI